MGGGIGHCLAEWLVQGESSIDLHELDPRRFGAYANKRYARIKAKEAFADEFRHQLPRLGLARRAAGQDDAVL